MHRDLYGSELGASQVTRTAYCPLPVGPRCTWQDLVHTVVAVLAFSAACWAMLQTSVAIGWLVMLGVFLAARLVRMLVPGGDVFG